LRKDDVIRAIDSREMKSTAAASDYIRHHGETPIRFTVERDGKSFDLSVTPQVPQGETHPRIGVAWADNSGIELDPYGRLRRTHPGPLEQVRAAALSVVNTFEAIASPKSDVKLQHMSGPVMMLRAYYVMFEAHDGWLMALWFSVVLNVNLALLNLIPMPVLDGGHIMLALVEAVRRRPVNARVLEVVQTACAIIIIGFMVYIAFFDVQDLFGHNAAPKFTPKNSSTSR
jgi:regulator of sigma E protease